MINFCSLFSGSSGNSLFFSDGETRLLIDAGLSAKKIVQALASIGEDPLDLSAVLISHEHSDHIRGAGIISRKFGIPIYANTATWEAMESLLGPVEACNRGIFRTGEEFRIGEVSVNPFSIPHDASEPVGFSMFAEDKKVTVATDIGHMTQELLKCLEYSDLLLLESKVGPYPYYLKRRIAGESGHLSNEAAGEVIAHMAEKGTKRFLLGHLSRENNFPELAWQTVYNALGSMASQIGKGISLEVAMRDRVGQVFEL
jgi:phosphoribosyl 1,2-cyclic phosphodiesterase